MRTELPHDNEVAESLFHAQVALKKSHGEDVHNLKFGREVELVSGLEQFRAAISSPGMLSPHLAFLVHFLLQIPMPSTPSTYNLELQVLL